MNKRAVCMAFLAIISISIAVAPPATSYGSLSGDQQYGAASCHDVPSSIGASLESSPNYSTSLSPYEIVTIWVNVTGAITGDAVGVLIASNTASQGSLPTENGWTIETDPSGAGTHYNYYKLSNYSGSGSFRWTLEAPTINGTYPIYALALHGGGAQYYKALAPVVFTVGNYTANRPSVAILFPADNSKVSGVMNISAMILPSFGGSISSATLKIDGTPVDTKTAEPFFWNTNTVNYSDGAHEINITAVDSTSKMAWQEITVTFQNGPKSDDLGSLTWTAIAGSSALIAACAALILLALFLRDRKGGGTR